MSRSRPRAARRGPRSLLAVTAALAVLPAPAVAASGFRLGDPRPVAGVRLASSPSKALSGSGGTALLLGDSVAHRDRRGVWRDLKIRAFDAVEIEDGGFMILWDDGGEGTTVRARIVRADGRLDPPEAALTDANLVWEGDFEARLWQVRGNGRGTVVVASRTAVSPQQAGGVIAAIRDPGRSFSPQHLLSPPEASGTTFNNQSTVAISPVDGDGTVSVGWDLDYHSVEPSRGLLGPWRQATRAGREPAFGPASAPSTGRFGLPAGGVRELGVAELRALPAGTRTVQTYARESRPVRVGPGVIARCGAKWIACLDPHVLAVDGTPALVFNVDTGGIQDRISEFLPETLLEGLWAAPRGPDGVFDHPRRVTFTRATALASPSGRRLLLAGHARVLTLTPAGARETSGPPYPRAASKFFHSGRSSELWVWCTRRCTLTAVTRYHGRRPARTAVHPITVPTPPRRTLDPLEPGLVPLRLTAGPKATRLTITLTARDTSGRKRRVTFSYRRSGTTWRRR